MMNKNERMKKLNNAGVDTKKYFDISLPNGLKPGATISLVINDDGQPVIVNGNNDNAIAEQIIADGYVRNTKLHRRFVMAQMFHMLNYVSYDKKESGFNACLRKMYGYHYTLTMMLDEVKVLYKLEQRDKESFDERSHFFTKEVVIAVLEDYMDNFMKKEEVLTKYNEEYFKDGSLALIYETTSNSAINIKVNSLEIVNDTLKINYSRESSSEVGATVMGGSLIVVEVPKSVTTIN